MSKYDKHFAEKHEIYIYKPKKLFLWHSIKCFITASSSTWVHVTVFLLRWNLGSVSVLNVIWPPETVVLHLQLLTAPPSLCLLIDKEWKLKDFVLFLRCCTTFHQPIHFLPTRLLFTPRPVTDKYSIKKLHQCTTMKQQHPVVRCNLSCQKLANSFMCLLWILFKCWDRIPHLWYCRYHAGVIIWFDTVIRKSTHLHFGLYCLVSSSAFIYTCGGGDVTHHSIRSLAAESQPSLPETHDTRIMKIHMHE